MYKYKNKLTVKKGMKRYVARRSRISTYGASLKSATIKAENGAGNTQVYWYSDNAKAFMRYGGDGVKSLSEQDGWMVSFMMNRCPSFICSRGNPNRL